eukprot:Awhi_evm1s12666
MTYFNSFLFASLAGFSYANPIKREICGPDGMTIADLAMANDEVSTLLSAIKIVDAVEMLSGSTDYT